LSSLQLSRTPAPAKAKKASEIRICAQSKKGNEWHFGMKMYINVDDTLVLTHSIDTTAANVRDTVSKNTLLNSEEQRVFGAPDTLAFNSGKSTSGVKTSTG
jgi:IS5 family transposase